jgi:hypothetical protein
MGVAAAALTIGLGMLPAMAFDDVDWEWEAKVETKVDPDIDVDIDVDAKGLAQVEIDQEFTGDVKAEAKLDDLKIELDGGHDGESVDISVGATAVANNISVTSSVATLLHIDQDVEGDYRSGADIEAALDIDGDVKIDIDDAKAVDVSLSATAVANNVSVEVDGDCGSCTDRGGNDAEDLLIADIEQSAKADVSATAYLDDVDIKVEDFETTSISIGATAVGNNVSIDVGDVTP